MKTETQVLVKEIEDIKERLIAVEALLLETEEATLKDKKSVKEALHEYKEKKTVSSPF